MTSGRLEAFSDGVIAIIITITMLELRAPLSADLEALKPLAPVFLSYVLSFVFLGIYWNNHHHLMQAVGHVTGGTLWANLHLLFWLSLIPFVTSWMGETALAPQPVAAYGLVLLGAAVAYFVLVRVLVRSHGRDSALGQAIGRDWKGKASVLVYVVAIPVAFLSSWLACALYFLVAAMWIYPDPRMERALGAPEKPDSS